MATVTSGFTKKALIRCPVECCKTGVSGHMHLFCTCGERIDCGKGYENITEILACPKCETRYTADGWIVGAQGGGTDENRTD